jgi:imidazole glycerol-phosphate synthase subunit HisH
MKIAIIDYGLGNLQSVAGAIERLGHTAVISNKIDEINSADKLILPGVGAFEDGMNNLKNLGLVGPLTRLVVEEKKPILGICLGCQLMAMESTEFGRHQGLQWIDAEVLRIEPEDKSIRVPHVGWDNMAQSKDDPIFSNVPQEALFYYTHSYYVKCKSDDNILGTCEYGNNFHAVVRKGNIYGTQFHPEKSQIHGLEILRNFIEKC